MTNDESRSELTASEPAHQEEDSGTPESGATAQILAELQELRIEVADLRLRLEHVLPDARSEKWPRGLRASLRIWAQPIKTAFEAGGTKRDWQPPRPRLWDAIALLILTISGFLLRFLHLTTIPPGIHGDEAFATLLARRVMDGERIGVFTGQAAGNPTGHVYLLIPFIKVFDDPIFAARFISVVGGTIAVVAMYVLVRRNAGFVSAVVATFLLVVSGWAIQFSRIGFVTGNWLPFALIGAIAVFEAIRRQHWAWWMLAGVLVISPIYIYNGATPVVLMTLPVVIAATIGIPAALVACAATGLWLSPSLLTGAVLGVMILITALYPSIRRRKSWLNLAAFTVPAFLAARPMISFAQDHRQDYFGRSRDLSVFRTQEWLSLDNTVAQIRFLVERYWTFHERLTFQPRSDGVDLSGITAPVPELLWWLFLFGMIISITRRPGWFTLYAAAVVLIAPFSAVLTDLVIRRSLIILPFACVLAGVGLSETVQAGWRHSRRAGLSLVLGSALVLGGIGWVNYDDFFNTTVKSQAVSSVFAVEFRETMEWVRTVPDGHHFILFINNQPVDHEVGQLIVPEIADIAENRLERWGGTGTYEVDRSKGEPVFVLVGADNIARLPYIQALYPGGQVITGPTLAHQDVPAFVSYFVAETP